MEGPPSFQSKMIADVDVAGLKHVDGPCILAPDAAVDLTLLLDYFMDVGAAGKPLRGQRAPHQDFLGMNLQPVILILVRKAGLFHYSPCFFEGDGSQTLQDSVRRLGTAIGEALAFPIGRVLD